MITIHPDTLEQLRKQGVKDDVIADEMAKANPHFASQVTKIRKKFGGDPAATTAFLNTRFYGATDHTPEAPKGLLGRSLERIYQNYQKDTLDIAKATQQNQERSAAAGSGFSGFSERLNAKVDQGLQTAGNVASIIASPLSQPLTEGISTAGKAVYDSVPVVKSAVQQIGQSDIVQKGVIPAAQAVASEAERNPALQSLAAVAEGSFDALDAAGIGMSAKPVTNAVVSGVEQLGKSTVQGLSQIPRAAGYAAGATARTVAAPFGQAARGFMQGVSGKVDDVAKVAVNQADDMSQELIGSAKEAVKAGMDEKLMRFAAAQNPDTRGAMAQMTRLAKKGSEKLGGDTAHKEVLGGYMMNNMSHILETKQNVGKALGAMKMGMKNEVIDLTDDYAALTQSLIDKGAVINGKGQITKLMGASDDNIPLLQQALDFLQPDDAGRVVTTSGKADMWRTKMFQEMNSAKAKLQPSSSGQSSLGFAEKVVNDLRRGAIKKMAKNNPRFLAYNDAFENLSTEASKFLKTIGYKGKLSIDDITAKELRSGEIALRTLGNASADTRDAFTSMLQTARKYGYSSNVDEMQLIRWTDALEDVFPITPTRSLKGEVTRGTRDAMGNMTEDVVRSGFKRAGVNRIADGLIEKIDALRGITPENRLRLLMDVLEAPPDTSFFQIATKALPDGMVDDLGKIQGIDAGDIAPAARAKIQTMNEDDLPLSTFSPQGVKDAAKMDDLVKGGMTPQEAAKSLNVPKTPKLTAAEKASLTPEERATGLIGGSDSVPSKMYYHGSPVLDLDKRGFSPTESLRQGAMGIENKVKSPATFFSDKYDTAKFFGENRAQFQNKAQHAVYESGLDMKKTLDLSKGIKSQTTIDTFKDAGVDLYDYFGFKNNDLVQPKIPSNLNANASDLWTFFDDNSFVSKLREQGFDSAILKEEKGLGTSIAVLDNKIIKSVNKSPLPSVGGVPKTLEPLAKEARKYKSAEEFSSAVRKVAGKKDGYRNAEGVWTVGEWKVPDSELTPKLKTLRDLIHDKTPENIAAMKSVAEQSLGGVSNPSDFWKQANQSK